MDRRKEDMRDRVSCAKVELPYNNLAKGDHKLDDHRNDKGYAHWNDDLNEYQSVTGRS